MGDDLNYKPPTDEIPDSLYGQYVDDGPHPVKCVGHRPNQNAPGNEWVDFEITAGKGQGELYSMNLYLPTKDNLNAKMAEKGGSREEALKAFFHYRQTAKAAGLPLDLSIKETLDGLIGWTGTAIFLNQQGYRTKVQLITGGEKAAPVASGSEEPF